MKNPDHKTLHCRSWLGSATMAALGGGLLTSSPAAVRDVPKVAGEYNQIDMPRFEMQTPAVRPAVIFDNISDASILALSAQGNTSTQLLRFTKVHNTLLYALQLLTPAAAFLNVEGNGKRRHYY